MVVATRCGTEVNTASSGDGLSLNILPECGSPANKLRLPLPDPAKLAVVVAPRQRGKSLARRKYQQGYVFQKGRKRSDAWLPEEPAYVQFWRDVLGQAEPKKEKACLGICRTRTIAERAAAEKLEQLGINSKQTFIETTSNITFKAQGDIWLKSLGNRKRNPLEQTTIDTRRYALDKWVYPFFEGKLLADVHNLAMRDFVEHISHLGASDDSGLLEHRESSRCVRHQRERRTSVSANLERGLHRHAVGEEPKATHNGQGRHGEHPQRSEGAVSCALCASRGMWSTPRRRSARS